MPYQPPAHLLIALALLKGVAGAVAVFKKRQRAAGEVGLYIVLDDGLLVLDGDVLLILLIIHGNAGIARDVKAFDQFGSPPFQIFCHLPVEVGDVCCPSTAVSRISR